jgi:arylsulfatase A-like enzyme
MAPVLVLLLPLSAAADTTSYMYGNEEVVIEDPSAMVYGCADVRNHTRYMGHDAAGDPTPGVATESLQDCCALCNANPECAHVTYNVGTCYMKTSAVGPAEPVDGLQIAASRVGPLPPPPPPTPPYSGDLPNLIFLIVESTDGRTYHEDSDAYMPNIRALQMRGAYFKNFYSNSPVCAASRTSIWSGRHVHRIPHSNQGVPVNGAWNNAEGNAPAFTKGWGDALETLGTELNYSSNRPRAMNRQGDQHTVRQGCETCSFGKTDWTVGSHALWNWLQCWTMYAPLPYNLTQNMTVHTSAPDRLTAVAGDGGWSEQPNGGQCRSDGTIHPGNRTHEEDWGAAALNTAWIRDKTMYGATHAQPFYVYQGMNIVHPPYKTTQNWYDKISDNLTVPEWQPLETMHPCGLQSAMLKGCIPTAAEAEDFYSLQRRRNVRRVYLAMIAEFDAMVGEYVRAIDDVGLTDRSIFIVTSDHGDMDMEQQQFYKMVSNALNESLLSC